MCSYYLKTRAAAVWGQVALERESCPVVRRKETSVDEKTSIPTLFSNAKPKAVAAYLKSKQLLPFGFAYGNLGLHDICQASVCAVLPPSTRRSTRRSRQRPCHRAL